MAVNLLKFEPVRIDGLSDEESMTVNMLLKQLLDKTSRNQLRTSFYDGKYALRRLNTIIPPQYYQLDIVLGWSAKAVDILARRCNCDTFVWPDGDLDGIGFTDSWEGNHLGSEISSGMVSSLLHGVSFLVNTVGDPDEDEAKGLIHVKDALSATGEWNARARRLKSLLSVTNRNDDGKMTGFALYMYNMTVVGDKVDGKWEVEHQPHEWGMPAEPLVYKPRVGRPFGQSRISRPVMSLHMQGLRNILRSEGHADVYSWPEMWMLGADEKIFKNPDGSPKDAWKVMLGRIKGIPDRDDIDGPLARAEVKQFPAASPQPHIDHFKQLAQMFSGETSIPLTSLGVSDMSNPTSADSYIASREDLIAEAEGCLEDWGPALKRSEIRSLAMQNDLKSIKAVPENWKTIAPKFRSPVYTSKAAEADAGSKIVAAFPFLAETEVGLELAGLTPQQIKRAMSEKRKQAGSAALRSIAAAAAARVAPPAVNDGSTPDANGPAPAGPGSANGIG